MFKKLKFVLFYSFLSLIVILAWSCNSAKSAYSQADFDALNSMVKNRQFRIESNMVYPQVSIAMQQVLNSGILSPGDSAGNISLIGNSNFLEISGDTITSYLPYFGERQMQVGYGGSDSSIEFKGIAKNYNAIENKDHSYTITFEAKSNSENFNVYIRLTPNLKSDMTLNGTSRSTIRYSGNVMSIKEIE